MVQGCYTIDTLLLSTLECFHLHSCISRLYAEINESYKHEIDTTWFQIEPLEYDANSSKFTSDIPLSDIVTQMMIEQWGSSFSFHHYFNTCAPLSCIYSFPARTSSTIGIMIKLLSTIGGLTLALRLITPQLLKAIFSLLASKATVTQRSKYCFGFDVRADISIIHRLLFALRFFYNRICAHSFLIISVP